ncbi:MAG: hypothetical protein KIT45_11760 [Fimbriimonadia bacterium]|nr:hypothetical protein [Fimbriimonadia bacterium]
MAVSADGSIVVGSMWHSSGIARAFRWETFQEAQDLGVMAGGVHSEATGISANGSVIVGYDTTNSDQSVLSRRAFLWTSGTMTPLSTLSGYIGSEATAVSADGSLIVGACYDASGNAHAVLWTSPTQVTDLGTLGGAASRANAISADGTTIVGWAMTNAAVGHAFLWRAGQGMQDLGTLPNGFSSTATSVSADGSAVVGIDYVLINPMVLAPRAVRWLTSAGTIEELTMTFAPWLNNSRLMEATGISADGNAIVGYGLNTATGNLEAYWLKKTTPGDVTGDGCVNDIDVLNVLFAYGQTGPNLPEDLNRDGIIDDADLLEVLFNFGNGC